MSKVIIDGVKVIINGVEIEYVPKVEEVKEWPQVDDDYYYVSSQGGLILNKWRNDDIDQERLACGNMFPTEQKAEYERLRRECMATKWVPEVGQRLYSFDFFDHKITQINQAFKKELFGYGAEVILGLARPTESEAKARWDMYGDAWMDALNVTTKK